jgi:hypothetical protein
MTRKNTPVPSREVNTLLRSELAHLWPAIANISALQRDCAAVLPQLFSYCSVLHLEEKKLVLAAPSAALASKLKQQLPKLQDALQQAGWQIDAIRIKVSVSWDALPTSTVVQQRELPTSALRAFDQLEKNLAGENRNDELLGALRTLLARRRNSSR